MGGGMSGSTAGSGRLARLIATRGGKAPPTAFEQVLKSPVTRTVAGVVARGLMGALLGSLGVSTAQYDWSPPAAGDPRLAGLVRALDNA